MGNTVNHKYFLLITFKKISLVALDSKNQSELVKALLKNVYGSENTMGYEVNCLAAYVANVANELSVQSDHLILSGKISFPKVEEIIEKHD